MATLMERLGYRDWVAQGGDWGGVITSALAAAKPAGCRAVHLNMLTLPPQPGDEASGEPDVLAAFAAMKRFSGSESAYARQQATRPQTLGYGLADSPVGQAAWIYEKLHAWTDNGGTPENLFSLDEMLDNIMLYWLPNAAASSARLYWEDHPLERTGPRRALRGLGTAGAVRAGGGNLLPLRAVMQHPVCAITADLSTWQRFALLAIFQR